MGWRGSDADAPARRLAAELDATGDDLAANGLVSPTELRRRLPALEREWAEAPAREAEAAPQPR